MLRRIATFCIVLAIAACSSGPAGPTATPANTFTINVAYASSAQGWMQQAISAFNNSGAKTGDGRPIAVIGQAMGSGAIVEAMVQSNPPYDMVIPADKVWMDVLAQRRTEHNAPALTVGTCTSIARSPVVMVVWRPMAEALGWPDRQFTWNDISELALSPSAWEGYDHPEWGKLTFGHAHPLLSDGGLDATLGEAYAAGPLTDVKSDTVTAFVRGVERSVSRYGSDSSSLIQTMAQRGQRYLHVAVGYESDVIANHTGDDGLVAIYPTDTFVANYQACPLGNNAAIASQFAQFLTTEGMQRAALAAGLRPVAKNVPLGAPIDAAHGADATAKFNEIQMPGTDVVRAVQDLWGTLKRPLNVTMVIDTSGSMKDAGKIQAARTGAQAFVKRLADEDTLTLFSFNSDINLEIAQANVGKQRDSILNIIGNLKADGGTALYDAVYDARSQMKIDPNRINALVVLTDGQDTESKRVQLDPLIQGLQSAKGTVIIYTIGYGGDADQAVMARIADAGNGTYFSGDPTTINQVYLEIANQVGGSRGLGR
jgi:Ca-activated chloride channel family protein